MTRLPVAALTTLQRIEHAIDAALRPVVFAGMAALIGVITLQIVSRVFFEAVGWTEEVARFLLVWITFLGATLAFQRGRHIAVTFVVDALPDPLQRVARIAAVLVALGFMIALMVIGYRYMQVQSFQKSASLRLHDLGLCRDPALLGPDGLVRLRRPGRPDRPGVQRR